MTTGLEPPERSIEERNGEWTLRGSIAKLSICISLTAGTAALLSLGGLISPEIAGAAAIPPAVFWLWVLWQSDKQNARDRETSA